MGENKVLWIRARLRGSLLLSEHITGDAPAAAFRVRKDAVTHPHHYTSFRRGLSSGRVT